MRRKEHKKKFGDHRRWRPSEENWAKMFSNSSMKEKIIPQESSSTENTSNLQDITSMVIQKDVYEFPFDTQFHDDEYESWFI